MPKKTPQKKYQKWEYIYISHPNIDQLNGHGLDGWELIFVGTNRIFIFKRPLYE